MDEKYQTKIISGFPGIGKTYAHENLGVATLDSDSSKFSWIEKGVRHPDFPNNYIRHIKANQGEAAYIFVSSHDVVRNALVDEGIDYTLVFPDKSLKDEYVQRFKERGSPDAFIDLLSKNWDAWISELEDQEGCTQVRLQQGQHLSDILES